ncbi:addiction module antidote protein [Massilia pseudoviolaceinigra]|uniref:addiction module antidote protein n=1 Tax=Massilia pseudoviolaceinigra TaxID=3057165 RepID=UPI00279644F2|nr:addiction module antidote protein [Massilia sp. CCM 9206]MDQ1923652.1 putative addiction module antidote protein [Massilia sp. CCM 9206]
MKTGEKAIAATPAFDMDAINALPRFDAADHLDSDEEITAYLNVYLDEEDVAMFVRGLSTVARARAKTSIAPGVGDNCDALYNTLCEDSAPRLATVMQVMKSLGLRLVVEPSGTSSDPAMSSETPDSPS